jgi:glutathione synthase
MKISSDTDFLLEQTKDLEKDDEFVRHFTDILRKVKDSKIAQRVKLSMTRNDFIIDKSGNPLQVELNMYASSLGPISQRHSRALFNVGQQLHDVTAHDLEYYQTGNNEEWLARSMEAAWRWYGKNDAIVVLVVPKEKNALDQFAPATILAQKGIPLFRYSFDEMEKLLEVDEATGVATILGKEVALFYFRDGYMPHHYNTQRWPVREKIELSSAVKCPDVAQVLVNMKYFQYIINKEETWTRFGFTPEQFQACRKHYSDIYTFWDFDSDKQKMKDFIEANGGVKNWVMKPQREGGANNVFGDDISKLMESSSNDELHAYILMKLIDASTRTGIQCTWAHMQARAVIDEMGMFYSVFQEGDKVLQEVEGGTLVRSKVSGTNEGGVAFGFSVINSVKLKV